MAEQAQASPNPDSASPAPDIRSFYGFDVDVNPGDYTAQLQQALGQTGGLPDGRNTSGITIRPAPHLANGISLPETSRSAEETLGELQREDDTRGQLIQSSFQDGVATPFATTANGFVDAATQAYNQHRHLRIRPEDVWLSILTQLSSYINAHAEELRGSFVAHEGKKKLEIQYNRGNRFTISWADFSYKIGTMIQDNVVDPELREWSKYPAIFTKRPLADLQSMKAYIIRTTPSLSFICAFSCV
jgi:hypothetical protein